jgi:hypothetical protein
METGADVAVLNEYGLAPHSLGKLIEWKHLVVFV